MNDGEAPCASDSRLPTSRWKVVSPPFVVLGLFGVAAAALGWLLARILSGGLINLETVGYAIAWIGYGLFAAIFLWVDAFRARGLRNRTWASRSSMWWTTAAEALVAAAIAPVVGGSLFGLLAQLGTFRKAGIAHAVELAMLGGVVLSILTGVHQNIRARRSTTIAAG